MCSLFLPDGLHEQLQEGVVQSLVVSQADELLFAVVGLQPQHLQTQVYKVPPAKSSTFCLSKF